MNQKYKLMAAAVLVFLWWQHEKTEKSANTGAAPGQAQNTPTNSAGIMSDAWLRSVTDSITARVNDPLNNLSW